ncbi:reverse transcriptase, partial [Tanacetum coccineum]
MSILSWNVQGLGNPWTSQHMRSLVNEHSPTIMFPMETRLLGCTETPPRCRMTFPKRGETGKRRETRGNAGET